MPRVRINNGLCLNYQSAGSGAALVLTHGLGSNLHYWDRVCPTLTAHHRVVRWDLRGSGGSDKPPGPYSPALFASDLAALLDALNLDPIHLLGISLGGVIAQRFALDYPQRLLSLLLVSTSSEVGPQATANWRRLADLVERNGFDPRLADATRSFSPAFAASHPDIVDAVGHDTLANDAKAYAATARAASKYHWTAELARVAIPTLVLQGLDDQLTPPGGSVKMQRALPQSRLLMFPETGHNLPIEQSLAFCTAILGFTAGIGLSASPAIRDLPK